MRTFAALSLGAVLVTGVTHHEAAQAADLAPMALPPVVEVAVPDPQFEFGTGWYLRGDVSFGPEDSLALSPTGFKKSTEDWDYGVGGGVGYKFTDMFRADITGDYLQEKDYTAQFGGSEASKATIHKYDALANLYVDLGSWSGITPYVGGGVGVAIYDPSEHLGFPGDKTGTRTTLAWAAMAGIAYQVDPNILVDVGYRHLDLGRFATTLLGYPVDHHYTDDQIRIGLRYMIY